MKARTMVAVAMLVVAAAWGPAVAAERTAGTERADDTGRNVRDRVPGAKTADDQSNDPADLRVTQEIRRALTRDDSLSTNAHNVKIITVGGVVTLRGPVDSDRERTRIQAAAEGVAGVTRVENRLEVTSR